MGTPPTAATPRGFAVVDVETTGLDPRTSRVIEIAVTQVSHHGEIEQSWSSLLHVPGDTGPQHIHGISPADIRDSPGFKDVAPLLTELLAGRILVAHNAAFDWRFLAMESARSGVDLGVRDRLCTVKLARKLSIPAANLKLGTLADYWGIPVLNAHRAADDVRVLVQILTRCLEEADHQGTDLPLDPCFPARP